MDTPYDYIQIVTDDDWGLVGIVPNNGSGDKIHEERKNQTVILNNSESSPKKKEPIIIKKSSPAKEILKPLESEINVSYNTTYNDDINITDISKKDNLLTGLRY